MDFFILLVLNIFIGAIIFLLLSLKIEKTSSTFQEKKMRELISECDATAERYITLLENRISIAKKVLNLFDEAGSSRGVDFTISDDKLKDNNNKKDIIHKHFRVDNERDLNTIDLNNIDLASEEEEILNHKDQQSDNLIDIEELFQKTDDKYGLIASLFADGYSIEELSKYSGIPSGEIKLVISLNT